MAAPEIRHQVADPDLRSLARRFLGPDAPPPDSPTAAYISALSARLERAGQSPASPEQSAHLRTLQSLRHQSDQRLDALEGVDEAAARLAELSGASEILAAAPAELAGLGQLRRVLVGAVHGGALTVLGCAVRSDPEATRALARALGAEPVRLVHPHVETELLRRQQAVVVDLLQTPQRVHPRLLSVMTWRTMMAAPVIVEASVVAVLYADRGPSAAFGPADGELVSGFAVELARAYEMAQLRRAVRVEREATRGFAVWLDNRCRELWGEVESPAPSAGASASRTGELRARTGPVDSAALFGGVLTKREMEVLQLVSAGHSNRRIAADLVLSPATVKSHVYRILSKLQVANRAEAVALYLGRLDARSARGA